MLTAKIKNALKILCLAICSIFILIPFSGCVYRGYSGKYPDLFTAAINSVLWNCGHSQGADRPIDSKIEILETDEYGRTLFTYMEARYTRRTMKYSALLVAQYTSDDQVFYYEDCNYIVKDRSVSLTFGQNEMEHLKEINDWNKPINADKCIGKTIIRKKQTNSEIENAVINKVITEYDASDYQHFTFADYLTDDKNGNSIFYGIIDRSSSEEVIFFVAFVSANGEIKIFTPSDLFNYNEELKAFKAENGWVS